MEYDCRQANCSDCFIWHFLRFNLFRFNSGINKRIELISSRQHRVTIATSPELITCVPYDVVTSVEISVALDMSDVASATGCDRDAYALQDVRRMCGEFECRLFKICMSCSVGRMHKRSPSSDLLLIKKLCSPKIVKCEFSVLSSPAKMRGLICSILRRPSTHQGDGYFLSSRKSFFCDSSSLSWKSSWPYLS